MVADFETMVYQMLYISSCAIMPMLVWVYIEYNQATLKQMNRGLSTAEIFRKAAK